MSFVHVNVRLFVIEKINGYVWSSVKLMWPRNINWGGYQHSNVFKGLDWMKSPQKLV